MFNEYMFGSYLLANGINVFIDARADVFIGNGVMEDCMNVMGLRVNPQTVVDKYDIRTVVIITGSPLAIFLDESPAWVPVYFDHTAVIFVQSPAAN